VQWLPKENYLETIIEATSARKALFGMARNIAICGYLLYQWASTALGKELN
jgi:hypothetical protein